MTQENVQDLLEKEGFYLFRQVCEKKELEYARSCFSSLDRKVNYQKIEHFIKKTMLRFVNQTFDWKTVYTKYRVSDNNNSSDAGAFHRDIIKYNQESIEPCYTCLVYLDSTIMEIIPASHRDPFMSYGTSFDQILCHRKQIKIEVGDLLFFQASLLHRGIFTENLPHRRLIQVFEIFPSMKLFKKFSPHFRHIPASPSSQSLSGCSEWIFRQQSLSDVCNWLGYLNASTGYGYKFFKGESKESKEDSKNLVYSSEGTRSRIIPKHKLLNSISNEEFWEGENHYVIVQDIQSVSPSESKKLAWNLFTRQFTLFLTLPSISIGMGVCLYNLKDRNNRLYCFDENK